MSKNGKQPKVPQKQGKNGDVGYCKPPVEHQFKPGKSPNPGGRPKGSLGIWKRIRRELAAKVKEGPSEGKRFADLVAKSFVKEMLKGKWPQMKELIDREEGPITQAVKFEGSIDHTVRPLMEKVLSSPAGLAAARTLLAQREARVAATGTNGNGNGHHANGNGHAAEGDTGGSNGHANGN